MFQFTLQEDCYQLISNRVPVNNTNRCSAIRIGRAESLNGLHVIAERVVLINPEVESFLTWSVISGFCLPCGICIPAPTTGVSLARELICIVSGADLVFEVAKCFA